MSITDGPRCKGKSRRTGLPCGCIAMPNGFCRLHGGKALRGALNGNYKSGRYSSVLPVKLASQVEKHLADPSLLSARDEAALASARIEGLLAQMPDDDEAARTWEAFAQHMQGMRDLYAIAKQTGEEQTQRELFTALDTTLDLYDEGMQLQQQSRAVWSQVADWIDIKRRVVDGEVAYIRAQSQVITSDRLAVIVSQLIDILRVNIADRPTLARIQDAINDLATRAISAGPAA